MDKVNPKFKDPKLYLKVKNEVLKQYKKNSAYRSMLIVKKYKEAGGEIKETNKAKTGTGRWNKEKWINLTAVVENKATLKTAPPCGKKAKGQKGKTICRPTVKASKDTAKLAQTYTKPQLLKAQRLKNLNLRVDWSKL